MNIGRQWSDRLKLWLEAFPKHYFRPWGSCALSYHTSMDHLTLEEALGLPFSPAPVGMKWGKKWEYGWFRTRIAIPEALAGQRVVFTLGAGEEMLVWVDGQEAGAIDKQHKFITLSRCATPGTTYEIVAECYAGHGIRNEGAGIVGPDEQTVPEPPAAQQTVKESLFGAWNEDVFQASMDYLALYSLVKKLPEKSLRAMKIIEGLKKFTYIADFELPEPELTASVVEAAKVLQPLLQCKNGSTMPEFTIFGQSHLDLAWLWPEQETIRKTARTYSNQLALMDEYVDYRFLLCEPPILEWLREHYPQVYSRVLEKTREGKFLPEGALWVESDTNIPSGESLIRQFVRGKRWFRKELGADSRMAWMPDTFGFSAALPQIMRGCGIPYFATQKLLRQDPEAEPFPYNIFWWEGMDGSRVKAHIFKKNNARFDTGDLITRWEEDRNQQEGIDGLMYPFGFGDGGGGPTRQMLELARRSADLEGAPRCRMESPINYFERQDAEDVFCGEMYLAWHRGTLTAQARTKQGIRRAEEALKKLEFYFSQKLYQGAPLPEGWREKLDSLWKELLLCQFHDVAPGTSIRRVHEEAENRLARIIREAEALMGSGDAVHNHQSFPITFRGVTVPPQSSIPMPENAPGTASVTKLDDGFLLENEHLSCRFDRLGQAVSVIQKKTGRETLAGAGNKLLLYKDVNTCYDAWEIGSMYENVPVPLSGEADITVLDTPEGAALEVRRRVGSSPLKQTVLLAHGAKRLDFITEIDWQERHKLLKCAFPVNTYTTEAIHEIQFGHVKRPVHRSRQLHKDQYEVCNHRYTALWDGGTGAAVLNDSKYGVSTHGNEIRLTLLRAPMMPDMEADRGLQRFTYSFLPIDALHEAVREGYRLNEAPILSGGESIPIFLPLAENIILETLKPADDEENALVARVYEATGRATATSFQVSDKVTAVFETDMLEENGAAADPERVTFRPFEIKTYLLRL